MTAKVKSFGAMANMPKKLLAPEEFAQVCSEAARNSTDGEAYISNVVAELHRWLREHGRSATLPEKEPNRGNVQTVVITLYRLLEERCEFDFDVPVVLNAYSPEYSGERDPC